MGAIGGALLGLIFLKVVIILLGALLYAIGPLMIGLVPTEGGVAIARAWASAAAVLLVLPLAWSSILAVGALLINDSSTAGPLIAGSGTIAHLLGGLLLALAGLASLWLCIRAAREAGAVLRGQLSGVLAVGGGPRAVATASAAPPHSRRAAESLRAFPGRVASAAGAALSAGGPAGQALAASTSGLAAHSRRGLIGASGTLIRTGAAAAAPGTAVLVGRTRAGAAAVRMARAGTASWQESARRNGSPSRPARTPGFRTGAAAAAPTVSDSNGTSRTRNVDPSDARVPPAAPAPRSPTVPTPPASSPAPGGAPQPTRGSASTGRRADRAVNRTNAASAPPRPNAPTDKPQQPRPSRPLPKPRGAGKPRGRPGKGGR